MRRWLLVVGVRVIYVTRDSILTAGEKRMIKRYILTVCGTSAYYMASRTMADMKETGWTEKNLVEGIESMLDKQV